MVKINPNRRRSEDYPSVSGKGVHRSEPGSKDQFAQDLVDKQSTDNSMQLKEILTRIDRITERLSGNLNLDDLIKYKKLVQMFLQEATSSAYRLEREKSFTRRGARSILVSVKKINEEVQQLLDEFMNKKKEPVNVLETLDKIRGMLVDLMA
ncbi:MAG: YaaR family protein [Chitinophagales bacterium]